MSIQFVNNEPFDQACLDDVHAQHVAHASTGMYAIECLDDPFAHPELIGLWESMLVTSRSEDKIYQSPAFFRFLQQSAANPETRPVMLLIRRQRDRQLVGMVPARASYHDLALQLGGSRLKHSVPAVQVLGSVMMLSSDEPVRTDVMAHLLQHFKGARLIVMQYVPQALHEGSAEAGPFASTVVHGWRECHTMSLPDSFEAYLQKFSSKKRYNLTRQVRLLAEEAGEIELVRVENPNQTDALASAIDGVVPGTLGDLTASRKRYRAMAENGLVLSYIVRCNGRDMAVVLGSRAADTWYVHKIYCMRGYAHLSLGTSALHLALQDVISELKLRMVDFGYGAPAHDFGSTNIRKSRGYVVYYRKYSMVALLVGAQQVYDRCYDQLATVLKGYQRKHQERRARLA